MPLPVSTPWDGQDIHLDDEDSDAEISEEVAAQVRALLRPDDYARLRAAAGRQ